MAASEIIVPDRPWINANYATEVTGYVDSGTLSYAYTASRNSLQILQNTLVDGDRWIELEFSPIDCTNKVLHFSILRQSAMGSFAVGVRSGVTPGDNYVMYVATTVSASGATGNQCTFDLSQAPTSTFSGVFDITDVRAIRIQFNTASATRGVTFYSAPMLLDRDTGLVGRLGDSEANGLDISNFGLYLTEPVGSTIPNGINYYARGQNRLMAQGVLNYYRLPISVTFGDGLDTFLNVKSNALVFSENNADNIDAGLGDVVVSSRYCNFNTSQSENVQGLSVIGSTLGDNFRDLSAFTNEFTEFFTTGLVLHQLGQSNYVGTVELASGLISGGNNVDLNIINSSASTTYQWNGSADLSGTTFDSPLANYSIDFGDTFTDGTTFNASDLNFASEPLVKKFRLDATGKTLNLNIGSSSLTAADVEVVAGTLNIVTPANQIAISGIPDVPNAVLVVQNLTTLAISYPVLSGGGATVELNVGTTYKFSADAPGYLRQSVTLPGNTPTFTFELDDFRALYDIGVNRNSDIAFNYSTLEVTVSDGTANLSFADVFRTIEDYLSTNQGVLFDFPPFPVIVDVGGGNGRNYLFFPYDTVQDQVNPVRIKPDPANTSDPTLTDFVIVLQQAPAPLFDIFDFTAAGGRIIRSQTEAVAASVTVSGSGALTTEQSTWLETLFNTTTDGTGAKAFSATALAAAGGGGSGLTQQQVRDALKLAPSAGTFADNLKG